MRIEVTRTGGFAGITLRRKIDTRKLSATARRELEELVERARTKQPPRESSPDAFAYELIVDGSRYEIAEPIGQELIEILTRR